MKDLSKVLDLAKEYAKKSLNDEWTIGYLDDIVENLKDDELDMDIDDVYFDDGYVKMENSNFCDFVHELVNGDIDEYEAIVYGDNEMDIKEVLGDVYVEYIENKL